MLVEYYLEWCIDKINDVKVSESSDYWTDAYVTEFQKSTTLSHLTPQIFMAETNHCKVLISFIVGTEIV